MQNHLAPSEMLISLSEAAKLTPGRPHSSTIFRWHKQGVRGIKLEARRYGGKIFTSPQWLDDFSRRLAEVTQADPESHSIKPLLPHHKRTQAQRDLASQNAVAVLKARGL